MRSANKCLSLLRASPRSRSRISILVRRGPQLSHNAKQCLHRRENPLDSADHRQATRRAGDAAGRHVTPGRARARRPSGTSARPTSAATKLMTVADSIASCTTRRSQRMHIDVESRAEPEPRARYLFLDQVAASAKR